MSKKRKIKFRNIGLEQWQWDQLREMIDGMQNGGATVGLVRFLEGGLHFQPLAPHRNTDCAKMSNAPSTETRLQKGPRSGV